MSEWQDISTAPKDGTRILLTDGTVFSVGYYHYYSEPEEIGGHYEWSHANSTYIRAPVQPNPKAGERRYFWVSDDPAAFNIEDQAATGYDGDFFRINPTHWMPLPAKPTTGE